jgi:hypothetical protein
MPQARDLGRVLQPPSARERADRVLSPGADVPGHIGPVEFEQFGAKWMAVRCPSEFNDLMWLTGGLREAGSRRWLIARWRINPLMRELRRTTDPLFQQAGMDLDGEGDAHERPL